MKSAFGIILAICLFALCGCTAPKAPEQSPTPDSTPEKVRPETCCTISADREGLQIFVDGLPTGKVTPSHIELSPGELVSLGTLLEPATKAFLIQLGEHYQTGAWVVEKDSTWVRLAMQPREKGSFIIVETEQYQKIAGADFNASVDKGQIESFIENAAEANLLYIDRRMDFPFEVIGDFTTLHVLDAENCGIENLEFLAGLTTLRFLNLARNNVSDLSALAAQSNLRVLDVEACTAQDFASLAKLTELRALYMIDTKVDDLNFVAELANLRLLDISGTDVKSLSPLGGLVHLEHLSLQDAPVKSLAGLANLVELIYLDISGCPVLSLEPISSLQNLRVLKAKGSQIKEIATIARLSKLSTLDLSDTRISDISALASLANLEELGLRNTGIENIDALTKLAKLRKVNLAGTRLPQSEFEKLAAALPGCKIIGWTKTEKADKK